jgi:hypothetical protein
MREADYSDRLRPLNVGSISSSLRCNLSAPVNQTLERNMRTIHNVNTALAVAFSAFAFAAFSTTARTAPITPPGHYCLEYNEGGTDCSFTSFAQCQVTAMGIDAECYRATVRNDDFRSLPQHDREFRGSHY